MLDLEIINKSLPNFEKGTVWLVGTGPGDIGLLNINAIHSMQKADVVLYDALVNPDFLEIINKDAEVLYVGKRGGKASTKQSDIIDMLIGYAKAGKRVLRLKGGDPFVFGRGGEEALKLVENDINFRVVPGITAGIGGLAYAGIPATHRDVNCVVSFVTGHALTGNVPECINWNSLVNSSPVIVMYMAIKHIIAIKQNLLDAGIDPNKPVAIVENASYKSQVVKTGTVSNMEEIVEGLSPPCIIVVGDVVSLREKLDWINKI